MSRPMTPIDGIPSMLSPLRNAFREMIDMNGLWSFAPDPGDIGLQQGWNNGFVPTAEIAVPGSWNEQLEELGLMNYVGAAWYSTTVYIPESAGGRAIHVRVGSADYHADVWVNGTPAGSNDFGFLPFTVPVDGIAAPGTTALVVIRVDNRLSNDTIPQGISSDLYAQELRLREETFPPARFDFTPFGGIHRPVHLLILPPVAFRSIRVTTLRSGRHSAVSVRVGTTVPLDAVFDVTVTGNGTDVTMRGTITGNGGTAEIAIDGCRFWSPADPFLYQVTVRLIVNGSAVDEYTLPIGVREVRIQDGRLLLNGEPVYLKGFGKHEDSPVAGKGLSLPVLVKDLTMMRWMHANSFRTSHYPYAEEMMSAADRAGLLVIDEVPAVSLDFRHTTPRTLAHHKEFLRRLIERDANHPCVIMWALGNEPNLAGDPGYTTGPAGAYWSDVFREARALDPSRPLTVPNCLRAGIDDPVLALSDVICLNRYYGWYEYPGQLAKGCAELRKELLAVYQRYGAPVMMSEFGADTVPGLHSTTDQMFTEEYQERFLTETIGVLRSLPFVIGEHVWNFADFRTPQNMRRVMFNLKGVFTRTRSPKMAAFTLRRIWNEERQR